MKGWRKSYVARECRRPVSFNLLARLLDECDGVCYSEYDSLPFSTEFVLMFFAALRISELLPSSSAVTGVLRAADMLLGFNNVRIHICHSKTDVVGRGVWLPLLAIPVLCALYFGLGVFLTAGLWAPYF